MRMTAHFNWSEFLPDGHTPTDDEREALLALATELEIVRRVLGDAPIRITSGLRTRDRNRAVGGSATSHHVTGHAADFQVEGIKPHTAFAFIKDVPRIVRFDQLIEYTSHVHLSVHPRMRRQAWRA